MIALRSLLDQMFGNEGAVHDGQSITAQGAQSVCRAVGGRGYRRALTAAAHGASGGDIHPVHGSVHTAPQGLHTLPAGEGA